MLMSWLLENQKTIKKHRAPEGAHMHCLAKAEGMFVSRVIRKRGKCKPSCFPLVFQKDGLIWQSKPHSHQWAMREGSQQPPVVTSCRCCRKSDKGHFHHVVTTSHLESALSSVLRIMCCWWRKNFPFPFVLILVLRLGTWDLFDFYFVLTDINTFHFYRGINFSICSCQQPSRHLSSVPSSTITLPDKMQWVEGKVAS